MKAHLFNEDSELNYLHEPSKTLCGLLSSHQLVTSVCMDEESKINCSKCDRINQRNIQKEEQK